MSYENENNAIDGDINNLLEDIASLEGQASNAQSDLTGLQKDIAEVGGLSEKFKSEGLHYHKATQAEIMRNNDLTKALNQAENTLRLRVNQVDEGNKELSGLTAENGKLGGLNGSLREDIEYCRKHLENLSLLNSDVPRSPLSSSSTSRSTPRRTRSSATSSTAGPACSARGRGSRRRARTSSRPPATSRPHRPGNQS